MTANRKRYEGIVTHTLAGFQLLEFTLKNYISVSYQLIQSRAKGTVPFRYSYKDVENHPLERLRAVFGKLSENEELISKLGKLVSHRNELAHRALIPMFRRELSEEDYLRLFDEWQPVMREVDECLGLVNAELALLLDRNSLQHDADG